MTVTSTNIVNRIEQPMKILSNKPLNIGILGNETPLNFIFPKLTAYDSKVFPYNIYLNSKASYNFILIVRILPEIIHENPGQKCQLLI